MARSSKSPYKDCVSIVIEATDIRYLALQKGRVARWGSVPLAAGLVNEGLIVNAMEVGRALEGLFAKENLDRRRVVAAVCGLRSIPRLLTMPRLQASMMEAAISREAKREMPVSLENLYLSWQSLPSTGDQQRIYLLGVPRDLVDAQYRTFQAAGIPLRALDLKPLALVRAVSREEAVIVNLEQDMLDLILVVDYLPAIMRTFTLNPSLSPLAKVDRLVSELNQTIRFYNDSHPTAPIEANTPVCLTGRLLAQREAIERLRGAVDRPVERPLAPLPCPEDLPVPEYMVNLGLVMKAI